MPAAGASQNGHKLESLPPELAACSPLQGLPGKAPTLYRRMGAAGEPAVHLLSRLLTFEPRHRASAAEALAHEYFVDEGAVAAGGRQPARPGAP